MIPLSPTTTKSSGDDDLQPFSINLRIQIDDKGNATVTPTLKPGTPSNPVIIANVLKSLQDGSDTVNLVDSAVTSPTTSSTKSSTTSSTTDQTQKTTNKGTFTETSLIRSKRSRSFPDLHGHVDSNAGGSIFDKFQLTKRHCPSTDSTSYPTHHDKEEITAPVPQPQPIRIYCDGIYDLFHLGHMKQLEQIKNLFPHVFLIVGVWNDSLTCEKKGKPILSEKERSDCLKHCKWVDQVIESAPWVIDDAFIVKHKIDYVVQQSVALEGKGMDTDTLYKGLKESGKLIATRKNPAIISTHDILNRILKDHKSASDQNQIKAESTFNMDSYKASLKKPHFIWSAASLKDLTLQIKNIISDSEQNVKSNWASTLAEFMMAFNATSNSTIDSAEIAIATNSRDMAGRLDAAKAVQDSNVAGSSKEPVADTNLGTTRYYDTKTGNSTKSTKKKGWFETLLQPAIFINNYEQDDEDVDQR